MVQGEGLGADRLLGRAARLLPAGAWMSLSSECCSGLCVGPILHLEEFYRLWCVIVCDLETSRVIALDCCAKEEKSEALTILGPKKNQKEKYF